MDAFVFQDLRDGADERIGIARPEREQQLGQPPVWADAAENLLVLHLASHQGTGDALSLEDVYQLGEFPERQPVHLGAVALDGGIGLFFDGRNNNFIPLRASRV